MNATETEAFSVGLADELAEAITGNNRRTSSRPAARSSMRSSRYVPTYGDGRCWSTPRWMSSSSRLTFVLDVEGRLIARALRLVGKLRRIRVRRGQVGERARGRARRLVRRHRGW